MIATFNLFILSLSSLHLYNENDEEPPCLCSSSVCFCNPQQNDDDDLYESKNQFLLLVIKYLSKQCSISVSESDQNKRAIGPVSNLLRLANYRIDYSQVNPLLHKLLVTKKKHNTDSFYNLLRYK